MRLALDPWVLVAGGFHESGGMDKANAALADYLLSCGVPIHLVAHHVDERFSRAQLCTVHVVPRPLNATLLGDFALRARGWRVATAATRTNPRARVVVNGGNLAWPDINWVHSVHRMWPCSDAGAPAWFKVKNRAAKALARSSESRAVPRARVVIANSHLTARHVREAFGCDPHRVHTAYLGSDVAWRASSSSERAAARSALRLDHSRPIVAFIGALSYDNNKGLDTVIAAWRRLAAEGDWQAQLVVAGGGSGLDRWQTAVKDLDRSVIFLGHTDKVPLLLSASDLLVSPSRYEAYGLNVHEAICHGVPAIASARSGVAERYPPGVRFALVDDPDDAGALGVVLRDWDHNRDRWNGAFEGVATTFRAYSWRDMAAEIVRVANVTTSSIEDRR